MIDETDPGGRLAYLDILNPGMKQRLIDEARKAAEKPKHSTKKE